MLACWLTQSSPLLCPFSYLASRTPCLSCLLQPPCFVLLSPLWPASIPQLLNTGACARLSPWISSSPPSLSPVYTFEISAPLLTDPSPEFKSWSGPPPPTPLNSRFTDVNRFPWASPSHPQNSTHQKWTLIFPPKPAPPANLSLWQFHLSRCSEKLTLQSSLTPLFLSHFQFTIKSCSLKTHTNLLSPWPKPPSSLDKEHLSGLLTGLPAPTSSPFWVQEPGWFF